MASTPPESVTEKIVTESKPAITDEQRLAIGMQVKF